MPVRTELIWDGKYDANGKRVAPLRVPLPFQNDIWTSKKASQFPTSGMT